MVDADKIEKKSREENIKYENKINFISVGRLHIDKSFDRVINVLSKLNEEGLLKDVKYRIIGDGEEFDNLSNLIKANHLEDIVELLGKKENPYPYVKASDLFIMSSLHESFGLVVIESLLLHTPVLSTEIASINELLNNSYGMIVPNKEEEIYNGIKKILTNSKMLQTWKKNLKEYKYNNEKIIKEIEKLFTK